MKDFRNNFSEDDNDNSEIGSETDSKAEIKNLVNKAVKGSHEAFGQLYRFFVKRIYRYVFYQVGDKMTAEDITADVFFKALDHIDSCEGKEATFQAWLYRIAHNCVIDYFRSRNRQLSLESEIYHLKQDPDKRMESRELIDIVSKLPTNQRQIIILKFIAGLSNREIGKVLGKNAGAVRIMQMRALLSLRKKLGGE